MIVWVVLKGKDSREFKRLFYFEKSAEDYINCGRKEKIHGAEEEFVEGHVVDDRNFYGSDISQADSEYCQSCQIKNHDQCSMTPGCPCCDDTIRQLQDAES